MPISAKHLTSSISQKLESSSGTTPVETTQLVDALATVERSIVKVLTVGDLPDPAKNKGRMIFVQSTEDYYFSDGDTWSKDFKSDKKEESLLYSWGNAYYGMLGQNDSNDTCVPTLVAGGFTDWCEMTVGSSASAGIRADGSLWTWGGNGNGALGIGYWFNGTKSSPVSVIGNIANWCQISDKYGLTKDGYLWDISTSPKKIFGGNPEWCNVQSSWGGVHAIKCNGTMWAFGNNRCGMGGIGTTFTTYGLCEVLGGFTDWCDSSRSWRWSLGIRKNGTIWTMGNNCGVGTLGVDSNRKILTPYPVCYATQDWITVSRGLRFTLAVKTNGTLWAWGRNSSGELGDGTATNRSSPVSVAGGFTDWCGVAASDYHSAAIRTNGTIWTWGRNSSGELGDGTATSRTSPVSVAGGFTDWCQISLGNKHAVALRSSGTLWTWGYNNFGQLGNGIGTIGTNKSSPVSVVGGFTDWCKIDSGGSFSFGIRSNGTMWAWGSNSSFGNLGNGSTARSSSPVSVVGGIVDWCQVSAGNWHTLALRSNGTLWSWGNNSNGELGDGSTTLRSSPVSVVGGFTDWCKIHSGRSFSFGIRSNGTMWAWGSNNYGQLGNYTTTNVSIPTQVCSFISIDSRSASVSGICSDGSIWTWGNNYGSYIGIPILLQSTSPVSIKSSFNLDNVCRIATGAGHSVALKNNGTIWSWGYNGSGQLGDFTTTSRSSPVSLVGGIADWCQLDAGGFSTVAQRSNGSLWAWGLNNTGHLGDCTTINRSSPVSVVGGFTDWSKHVAGDYHVLALRTNCTLWAWGENRFGKLGDGTIVQRSSPVSVVGGFTDWCKIGAGMSNSAGIRSNGTLWTWGRNTVGELGQGNSGGGTEQSSPATVVGGFTNWCDLALGMNHTAAIRTNGTMWGWGAYTGDGTYIRRSSPVSVVGGFTNWCGVFSGHEHIIGIRSNGTIWAWGNNFCGQVGNCSIVTVDSPVSVPIRYRDWIQASGGEKHTVALRANGSVWAWGYNGEGALGNQCDIDMSCPVSVIDSLACWCNAAAGGNHGVAVRQNGTIWTWGDNSSGQLGISISGSAVYSPVSVVGGATNWCKVAAKDSSTFAIRTDGTLWSWGSNTGGMLGIGTKVDQCIPTEVCGGFTDWYNVCTTSQNPGTIEVVLALRRKNSGI